MLTQRHTVVSIPGDGNSGVSQYDLGRLIHWKDFQRTNHLDQPPTILRTAVSDLESQHDEYGHTIPEDIEARMATAKVRVSFKRTLEKPDVSTDRLFKPGILHDEAGICPHCAGEDESALIRREPRNSADDEDDPAIHTGPITSGNTSLEAANVQDQIAKDDGVLCFEMEASRLMNWFPCLVILVICDYCVIHKNKGWQLYPLQRA
ncbi:Hypothetical protein D9617_5g069970 [Elsinoe fawcettii]|nr:Hypothetical protein D9617_5g069970 [Elsinoe fawcettii]